MWALGHWMIELKVRVLRGKSISSVLHVDDPEVGELLSTQNRMHA